MTSFYDFSANRLDGTPQQMAEFSGKVVLVVNVASKCGFTPQYDGLEALWRDYAERGLMVLGFPCNQFGDQEPGAAAEIAAFCSTSFDVTFPMFQKIDVNGKNAHPLFRYLAHRARGLWWSREIKWNFNKFLIDRTGNAIRRIAPKVDPTTLRPAIEALL